MSTDTKHPVCVCGHEEHQHPVWPWFATWPRHCWWCDCRTYKPATCPTCGGYDPGLSRSELPAGARYCTPLSCSAWTFTHRLTKQGAKPIRPDGRAALAAVEPPERRTLKATGDEPLDVVNSGTEDWQA